MRYQNIIWDFDGTLFDTYPGMCRNLSRAMASVGVRVAEEALLPRFLVSMKEAIAYCAEQGGIDEETAFQTYRAWVKEHPLPESRPYPGAGELLERFQAAGGRNFIFTHRGPTVHAYVAQEGWTPYFEEVVPFGPDFERKPSPSGNLYLMERHGLKREETLAVGDRELDILAAKAAGIDACLLYKTGVDSAADYQLRSFEELYAVIGLEKE